jgi:hypothetical protein
MTQSQYYYQKNKSLGLCTKCGKSPLAETSRTLCEDCLKKVRLYVKKRYAESAEVRDRRRETSKAWRTRKRAKAISAGICTNCYKEPADSGYNTCWRCRANARDQKKAPSDEQKSRRNTLNKARRERLIAAGTCKTCAKRPVQNGRKECSVCLARYRERKKERAHETGKALPHDMRGDGTYCYQCCKPKCNGEKLCTECYEKACQNLAKARKRKSVSGGWKTLNFKKIEYEVKAT